MGGGVSASGGELGVNERAWLIADAMAKNAAALRVAVRQLPGGARVIDAGIDATGGFGAGRALAEICTGGSRTSHTRRFRLAARRGPASGCGPTTRR